MCCALSSTWTPATWPPATRAANCQGAVLVAGVLVDGSAQRLLLVRGMWDFELDDLAFRVEV